MSLSQWQNIFIVKGNTMSTCTTLLSINNIEYKHTFCFSKTYELIVQLMAQMKNIPLKVSGDVIKLALL